VLSLKVVQKVFPPALHRLPDPKAAVLIRVFVANVVFLFVFAVFVALETSTVARHLARADGADVALCALVGFAAIVLIDVRTARSLSCDPVSAAGPRGSPAAS
jgi:protein-S-isoprenylcysteine O-methyltransferase Ste14